MAYDVFISYRRETGADDARLLQQALKARGYNVFFDYDSLRDGKFDEKIFEAIDEAPVFVLMLTERALDRCVNEDDWVRLEIERALSGNKHIVPVVPSSQHWEFPDCLPESLKGIPFEQISELNKASLFEKSIDQVVEDRFPEVLRKKCRSIETVFTTVASASTLFVGRDTEMARLHEILVAGKFPVVTGPGGTGKSELVRQYVSRYKVEYPGGLFQIDMEKATTWDVALAEKMLMPPSAPGVNVRRHLCLKENGDEEGEISFNKEDVIAALNIRAEREGGILLVLDNVESTRVFLREQILEKLSLCQNVRLLATARVSDVVFRPDDHCVEFPLADLSSEAALDLLLRDHPANSETERAAAANIVECLGRRVLYFACCSSIA